MSIRKLILTLLAAATVLVANAIAQTTQVQATVHRVTGTASVTMPDGSTAPLTQGMKIPQGATITTGADGDVYLESHAGYVTSIKPDSVVAVEEISVKTENGKVKEERTLLDLKSGDLVAHLDPKKKAVNNYQVRTPKGVAAARGTTFTITVKVGGTSVTIAVVGGKVTVEGLDAWGQTPEQISRRVGGKEVSAGYSLSHTQSTAKRIADLMADDPDGVAANRRNGRAAPSDYSKDSDFRDAERYQADANLLRRALALAVASVAIAAQNNLGGVTAADAAAVARTVFAAAPEVAAQAAAIINKSGGKTSGTDPVIQAIRNQVPSDQKSSFDSSAASGNFEQTTLNAKTLTREQTTTKAQSITDITVRSGSS